AHVGGLIGRALGGTVFDSHAYGAVSSSVAEVGGLIGEIDGGAEVESCSATGNVAITNNALAIGGLVGRHVGGSEVINCFATGVVTGYRRVGGLVGALGDGLVVDSWASGNANAAYIEAG